MVRELIIKSDADLDAMLYAETWIEKETKEMERDKTWLSKVLNEFDKPTEVEPLVVPKYLGEWLAEQNLGNEGSLFSIISRLEYMWTKGDFEEFISDNKKQLIEVILGTRPYEVEKEKLYYALNKQGETLLVFIGGEVSVSGGYALRDDNKGLYQLTEKQIKDYDERYWAFAEEVAE